jgi:hypothetical protein
MGGCPNLSATQVDTFPRPRYTTYIVDGTIRIENLSQIVAGMHSISVPDSIWAESQLADLDPDSIEQIEIHQPDDAVPGVCPGVWAVLITTTG